MLPFLAVIVFAQSGTLQIGNVKQDSLTKAKRDSIAVVREARRDSMRVREHARDSVRKALRLADKRGEPLVVVLGHPTYYPRFGFRPASSLGIEPPDPSMPDEAFMVVPLGAYDSTLRGRVTFPLTDAKGHVLGFGARAMKPDQQPK